MNLVEGGIFIACSKTQNPSENTMCEDVNIAMAVTPKTLHDVVVNSGWYLPSAGWIGLFLRYNYSNKTFQ